MSFSTPHIELFSFVWTFYIPFSLVCVMHVWCASAVKHLTHFFESLPIWRDSNCAADRVYFLPFHTFTFEIKWLDSLSWWRVLCRGGLVYMLVNIPLRLWFVYICYITKHVHSETNTSLFFYVLRENLVRIVYSSLTCSCSCVALKEKFAHALLFPGHFHLTCGRLKSHRKTIFGAVSMVIEARFSIPYLLYTFLWSCTASGGL